MRLTEVVREAWRDLASGAARAVTNAVVLAVLLGVCAGGWTLAVATDVRSAADYVASGAATLVQQAEGRIDASACAALSASDGVVASGALRRVPVGAVPAALAGSSLPTYEVSAGFLDVLSTRGRSGVVGVVPSRQLADELGVDPGDRIPLLGGPAVPVAAVYEYPDDGRDPDLEYALLAPTAAGGPFDACWATVWPEREDAVQLLRRTVLPTSGAEDEARPTVEQLNPRAGTAFVPTNRSPPWVPVGAAGLAGASVGIVAVLRRRLSLASDLHVGVPRRAQVLGVVLAHLVWASVAAVGALGIAVLPVRGLSDADAVPIVVRALVIVVAGVVGALLGGAVTASGIRERSLHRYFRAR
ncbi:hypothetical protein [Curtobacterium sp. ISL-83]|uniref:hypothetical protein n=1 Tax=Curtobacterium sp. ISL-83 TaxID=2819145 RepID=UPI001BE931C6|nr:hypothetical protein [Curtobacterium sp. ISL-83]MBT2502750.1 hypothetical protein [Curtobacterium sp. ISL-83]